VALTVTTLAVMLIGMWLPFSPAGPALGPSPPPWLYGPLPLLTLAGYVLLTQAVKSRLVRRSRIEGGTAGKG
jgi:Mg2+-importing ATPase